MRRIAILLGFLLLAWVGLAGVMAQEATPDAVSTPTPPPIQPLPQSIFLHPIDPATIHSPLTPLGGSDNGGHDSCQQATNFVFLNTAIGGVTANVEAFHEADTDPVLSCMWGNPSRPNGYRTVWYKFTAVTNAVVSINSDTSNYDTVVGVFTSADTDPNIACTTLTPVACNDDFTGFTSFTTFSITQGQTYYIVIADWSAASSGQQTLNIFIQPQPVEEQWQLVGNHVGGQVTHHDTAVAGADIYVVGGQTNILGTPNLSNNLYRYHVPGNSWQEMAQIPGEGLTDLSAVYVDGRIYVPSSDDGAPGSFNPAHYVYLLDANFWSFVDSITAVGPAVGWAQTVAAADQSGYYLIGGTSTKPVGIGTSTGRAETYFYDIAANQWDPKPDMTTARFGHMAARLGNRICVVGGLNGSTLLPFGECFQEFGFWEPIASLNIPRYGAGSAVGPDGRWYIFGGTTYRNGAYMPVSSTEVYDPAHPDQGWAVLGVPFDLVNPDSVFARADPAGEFVGNNLYAIGGNHFVPPSNYDVVPLVQRLYVPSFKLYLPAMFKSGAVDFDDNMAAARPLPFNYWAYGNFPQSADFYDFYYFDVDVVSGVSAQLHGIPSGSNYDLYVFNSNKLLWGSSTNPGTVPETINLVLSPGRYYVLVHRLYGPPDGSGYQVVVIR